MYSPQVWLKGVSVERDAWLTNGGVDGVEEGGVLTVEVVPPITHEVFLVEDGAVGT